MFYSSLKLRFPYSCFFAIAITVLVLAIEIWLYSMNLLEIPFSLFYPAVFLTAWLGGAWAGLFATGLSVAATTLFDLSLNGTTFFEQINGPLNSQRVGVFVLNSALASVLFGLIRRSFERAHRAERAALQSEQRFRQLAENIRDQVFYIMQIDRGELLYVSPAYEKIWRKTTRSLVENPRSFLEAIHEEDRRGIIDAIEQQKLGHQTSVEYRLIHPNGDIAWILDRGFPIRGRNGKVTRAAGIAEDVTAEKVAAVEKFKSEERLIQSEKKYRDLFDATPLPMWIVCEKSLEFLEVNHAACEKYGYSRAEFLNMDLMQVGRSAELEKFIHDSTGREEFERLEAPVKQKKKDGTSMDVQIISKHIDYEGVKARLIIVSDITAQIKSSNELRAAKQMAESASSAKSRFLANMSHEIRTPLGAVLGFAELMRDPNLPNEERKYFIDTILRNGRQLSMVINDILDLSKIESDRLDVERIIINPVELLEEVAALLRIQAQAKSLELRLVTEGKLPHFIKTDPTRLRQILLNLIGNSVKFTSQGRISIVVKTFDERGRSFLQFLVSDTGPGISDEHRTRLFQPFSQADSSTTRKFGGTGLGLALSKRLAEALGGRLELLESQPGVGSTFSLVVDAGDQKEIEIAQALPAAKDRRREEKLTLLGHKVLVVEDAPDNRVLLQRLLKPTGVNFECAENGVEGVRAALRDTFDLVLMDIQMPKMDGFEAIHELRFRGYKGPIVALTAHAMKGDRERCLEAGFDGYLVKPIDRQSLYDTLKKFLSSSAELPPKVAAPSSNVPSPTPAN